MKVGCMIELSDFHKHSLFGGFLPSDIERVSPLFERKDYAPGDCIIREGEANDSMFFLLEGEVRVARGG